MPALEVGVDPCWYGRKDLVERSGLGVGAQSRRNELADDAGVECIACQAHAAVAKQVSGAGTAGSRERSDAEQGEITCSSSEIADQDEFIMVERGFVGVRGGHRLQFEIHMFEPGKLEG